MNCSLSSCKKWILHNILEFQPPHSCKYGDSALKTPIIPSSWNRGQSDEGSNCTNFAFANTLRSLIAFLQIHSSWIMLCCSGSCFQPRLQTSINFLFETNTFYNWRKIHFYICDRYTPEIMLCFLASCFQPQLETFITPLVTLSSLKSSSDRPGWDMNKSLRHNSLQIWPLPDTNTGQSKASKAGGQQAYSSCFKASDFVWERHRG